MITEYEAKKQLLKDHPERPNVKAYAVVDETLRGPAFGVGITVEEAVVDAMYWLRASGGKFGGLTVVPITEASYHQVLNGYPEEWVKED